MSFLKTINIQHLTSGTNNIVLDANGNMTCAGTISAATPTGGMRNKIINGDMRIDQRNAGASVTPSTGQYTLDRWYAEVGVASKYSVQQNAGSVTPPPGFSNYLGVTSTSTYSLGSTDNFTLQHRIEGYNTVDLAWGTANAKPITLSFWVRSSLTGVFGGEIFVSGTTARSYPFTYRINTANTWEYETITIPGDTFTNTIPSTTAFSLIVLFMLGAGSTTLSSTANAWQTGNFLAPTGCVNVVSTNGATFYITGVQVETGSVATAFERRLYGTELALCQRYYYRFNATNSVSIISVGLNTSTTAARHVLPFPVPMRIAPTAIETSGTATDYRLWHGSGTTTNLSAVPTYDTATFYNGHIQSTVASGLTGGAFSMLIGNTGNTGYLGWSAEL